MVQQEELEVAFDTYLATLADARRLDDWSRFGALFTADGVYSRAGLGDCQGRAAISARAQHQMTTFPGDHVEKFEVTWHFFVLSARQVVFEVRHVMADPGDGSVHAASTTSMLTYAGEGLWSRCTDLQSRAAYAEMVRGWLRAAEQHRRHPAPAELQHSPDRG